MRNLSDKIFGENQNKIKGSSNFTKSCLLRNNEEKYGTAREDTDINIMRRMRIEL
jgi:hypothetical protein